MDKLRVLDLFSGIGGFSLGLERTGGFETVAFCEINPFARRVLAKHWPKVPCYDDVRTVNASGLDADGVARPDVICGGFPCQDISDAGRKAGLEGERSGLWSEIARLVGELRPSYVIVENVAALLGRGLDRVLGDLAALGYDAEWHCIPAAAVGAPHIRDRLWLISWPSEALARTGGEWRFLADAAGRGQRADQDISRRPTQRQGVSNAQRGCAPLADASRQLFYGSGIAGARGRIEPANGGWWAAEPDVGRVAHGVPRRVDRLRSLGNAVVPQIPEMIGRAILSAEASLREAA